MGHEGLNRALEATAAQRALGYSYETEKAFQTGVQDDGHRDHATRPAYA